MTEVPPPSPANDKDPLCLLLLPLGPAGRRTRGSSSLARETEKGRGGGQPGGTPPASPRPGARPAPRRQRAGRGGPARYLPGLALPQILEVLPVNGLQHLELILLPQLVALRRLGGHLPRQLLGAARPGHVSSPGGGGRQPWRADPPRCHPGSGGGPRGGRAPQLRLRSGGRRSRGGPGWARRASELVVPPVRGAAEPPGEGARRTACRRRAPLSPRGHRWSRLPRPSPHSCRGLEWLCRRESRAAESRKGPVRIMESPSRLLAGLPETKPCD